MTLFIIIECKDLKAGIGDSPVDCHPGVFKESAKHFRDTEKSDITKMI